MQSVDMSDANAIIRDSTRTAMRQYGLTGLGAIDPAAWEAQMKETGTDSSGFDWSKTISSAITGAAAIATTQLKARADQQVAKYTERAEAARLQRQADAAAARASGIPYPYGQPAPYDSGTGFPTWVIPVGIGVLVLGGFFMMRGGSRGGKRRRRR
ncbi:MAG: hypothetical protein ACYS5V_12275 [Planctomycetota bacterium]|jgi:hypothetical protein